MSTEKQEAAVIQKIVQTVIQITKAIKETKLGKSKANVETVISSGDIEIAVMLELRQRVLDGRGIPD